MAIYGNTHSMLRNLQSWCVASLTVSGQSLAETVHGLLGSVVIDEVDVFRHLGITISVSRSVLPHTTRSISSARSAFYALHAVGPRYGCLHPLTSLKLYFAYSCNILRFDLDVLSPTKSELLTLERCQLSILKSILGLPSRANSLSIHHLLGTIPLSLLVTKAHLLFLWRIFSN